MNAAYILENVPTPVLVYDLLANAFLYANAAFCTKMHISLHQIEKKPIELLDLYMSPDERKLIHEKFSDFSDGENILVNLHYANAFHKHLCNIKIIIQDEYAYGICSFHQVYNDIPSEQEEEVRDSHPWLTSDKGHQLRSLLNTLVNISHLTHGEKDMHYVDAMLKNLSAAGEKVIAMLDQQEHEDEDNFYTRVLEFHRYDIVPVIKEIIYKYTKDVAHKKIHLKFLTHQKEVELYVDLRVFTEVVDILTGLAVRLTNDGEVKIEIAEIFADGSKKVAVKIIDTGLGLKRAHLEILSTYSVYLASDELMEEKDVLESLLKCKGLTDRLSGGFQIHSQYGKGTEVSLIFPLPAAETPVALPAQDKADFIPEVLVVDDDQLVFRIIQHYLAGKCTIDYAVDGRRALMAVGRKKYDIIFMDINLGVGLTGLQVLKKMKELPGYADVPSVAITANALPGDKERALAAGCNFYQSKPFRKEDILEVFQQCVRLVQK